MYSKLIADNPTSFFHNLSPAEYMHVIALSDKLRNFINKYLELRTPADVLMFFISLKSGQLFFKLNSCLYDLRAKAENKPLLAAEIEEHISVFQKTFQTLRAAVQDQPALQEFLSRKEFNSRDLALAQIIRQSMAEQKPVIKATLTKTLTLLTDLASSKPRL